MAAAVNRILVAPKVVWMVITQIRSRLMSMSVFSVQNSALNVSLTPAAVHVILDIGEIHAKEDVISTVRTMYVENITDIVLKDARMATMETFVTRDARLGVKHVIAKMIVKHAQ